MRSFFLALCLSASILSFAQTDDINYRAQLGRLSLRECKAYLGEIDFATIYLSLAELKSYYEKPENYNEDEYFYVVYLKAAYESQIADYISLSNTITDGLNFINAHNELPNTDHTRQLWLFKSQLEASLKNFDQALHYMYNTQLMFEEANDFADSYLVLLVNMATVFQEIQDNLSAKIYLDEAIDIYESLHGDIFLTEDESKFTILSNYGMLNYRIGHLDIAEKCFKCVIDNGSHNCFWNQSYQLACNNLATLYISQKDFKKAEALLNTVSSENLEVAYYIYQNLVLAQLFIKNKEGLKQSLARFNYIARENIAKLFSNFTEVEREAYWKTVGYVNVTTNNIIASTLNDSIVKADAFENIIFAKNLKLNSSKLLKVAIQQSQNTELKDKYDQYIAVRDSVAFRSTTQEEYSSRWEKACSLERELIQSINNFGSLLSSANKQWNLIQSEIENGEAVIEFTNIPTMDANLNSNNFYGAAIITKESKAPIFVRLGAVEEIDNIIGLNSMDPEQLSLLYSDTKLNELYKLIWKDIEPYLKGKTTIYFSPTGLLGFVNFNQLTNNNHKTIGELYKLVRLSTSTEITKVKQNKTLTYTTALFLGDIDYNSTSAGMYSSKKHRISSVDISNQLKLRSENDRGLWGPIPATFEEINAASRTIKAININASILRGSDATEESVKSLSRHSPNILHFATHGFLLNKTSESKNNKFLDNTNTYSQSDAYMLRTGLLLAGANNVWQGKSHDPDKEDGILTAEEISRLDLSETKLVVLSACETGRGFLDAIDGVFGLQRAFKQAGAGSILMSLWKVQDDATNLLMTSFYSHLVDGHERHEALKMAMNDTRKVYPDPYYWAGFVLLD